MSYFFQKSRDAVVRLRRRIAAHVRRLADRIDAQGDAPKSQGIVS